jgi:hypothetical protein
MCHLTIVFWGGKPAKFINENILSNKYFFKIGICKPPQNKVIFSPLNIFWRLKIIAKYIYMRFSRKKPTHFYKGVH